MQKREVKATIALPMYFPDDWDDSMIWFHLNGCFCASDFLDLVNKYDEDYGCICNICEFEVVAVKKDITEEQPQ